MLIVKLYVCAAVVLGVYGEGNGDASEENFYSGEEEANPYKPKPYHFGYEIEDFGSKQHRHEHSDSDGTVRGSYGFLDEKGMYRQVHYVADDFGFRAQITTNEMGTTNKDPADVLVKSLYQPVQEEEMQVYRENVKPRILYHT